MSAKNSRKSRTRPRSKPSAAVKKNLKPIIGVTARIPRWMYENLEHVRAQRDGGDITQQAALREAILNWTEGRDKSGSSVQYIDVPGDTNWQSLFVGLLVGGILGIVVAKAF